MAYLDDDDDYDCPTCQDTGEVCEECEQAAGECVCDDGPTEIACPDCSSSGPVERIPGARRPDEFDEDEDDFAELSDEDED